MEYHTQGMDMLSINFNPSLLGIQNKLNTSNNVLNTSLQRLSTGIRINSTADDAAGYYVSQGLNSQIRGLKEAQNNISMGSSLLSTAEDTMNKMTDMLNRLNDLALQGANATLTDTERNALTKEANALVEEIKKQNPDTKFNGMNVFGTVSKTVSSNVGVSNVSSDVVPSGYTAIYTADDLNNVRNNLSGKYILMADIDLSSIENWEPIGNNSNAFTGTFDGNGHVIKNMTINRANTTYVGLFGYTDNATIKNMGLENVNVSGSNYTGGLAGYGKSTIENCYVSGSISGSMYTGGLVGIGGISISNCYVTGSVKGTMATGGIAGHGQGNITKCYVESSVSGTLYTGGISGYNTSLSGLTISNCYTTGSVSGINVTGGIAGSGCTVSNCYVNADIIKKDNATGNNFGILFGQASSLIATNVIGNADKSTIKTMLGSGSLSASSSNTRIVSESEFTTHSTWDCFDNSVWEMSCSIPPVLKGVGTNNINWNFEKGNNENRIQAGEGSVSDANSLTINTGLDLGAMKIDLSTVENCLDATKCVKAAINAIAKRTTAIGISQNRLENAANVNLTKVENLTSAHSNITNADIAEETANYTKAQIMTQTANSLLTQTQNFQANLLLNMINTL